MPPIRNKVEIDQLKAKKAGEIFDKKEVKQEAKKEEKQLKRDTTPMFDYYKAWDKFAAEEEKGLETDEILEAKNPVAEEERVPKTQAEMMQRTSGAKPNTRIVIKGGSVKKSNMADNLKAQGNAFFISLEYEKAIDCYTRCFPHIPESDHSLHTVVLSNRAQCHIKMKKYELAFQDANAALKFDPNHLKSIQRRGTAAYYTGRLRQAKKDFIHSLKIEPSKLFTEYLDFVEKKILKSKTEALDKLRRQPLYNSGVDFHGTSCSEEMQASTHPDEFKRMGAEEFKRKGQRIIIQEINLDEKLQSKKQERKQEVLKKQTMEEAKSDAKEPEKPSEPKEAEPAAPESIDQG